MNGTTPSADALQESAATLKVTNEPGVVSAEQLRIKTLELLESDIDLTIDFSGVETLDIGTLQILLAIEQEQIRKTLHLKISGVSPSLLRWFQYSGAEELLLSTPPDERTSAAWN